MTAYSEQAAEFSRLADLGADSQSLVAAGDWGELNIIRNGQPQVWALDPACEPKPEPEPEAETPRPLTPY